MLYIIALIITIIIKDYIMDLEELELSIIALLDIGEDKIDKIMDLIVNYVDTLEDTRI
jgi:hypothetical protein